MQQSATLSSPPATSSKMRKAREQLARAVSESEEMHNPVSMINMIERQIVSKDDFDTTKRAFG